MGLYHNIVLALFAAAAAAQQGVLTNGNSELPACGQSCPLLVQAAQACVATDVASQSAWICFCQSAYLTQLRTSAAGICDSTCTNPTDLQQVSTWYSTNCGSDNGASAHAGDGSGTATDTTAAAGGGSTTTTTETVGGDDSASNSGSSGSSGSSNSGSIGSNTLNGVGVGADAPETWWENHYKWIIMLIILAIAFPLIAWGAVWLKKRHDRKQDQINSGFNAGITERQPPMTDKDLNRSTTSISHAGPSESGRNSPQRTRDAYMPYGYGYSRSDSRNSGKQTVHPLARGETPVEMVERGPHDIATGKGKRVLVREKSLGAGSSDGKDRSWV